MKVDPYYQRQKCRPIILVAINIRYLRIFAGVPRGRVVKRQWGLLHQIQMPECLCSEENTFDVLVF